VLSYGDVGKLLAVGGEDALVLSLYLEMPQSLPGLREVRDRVLGLLAAAADAVDGQVSPEAVAAAEHDVRTVLETSARYWLGHGAGIFLCGSAGLAERVVLPAGLGERAVFASRPHVRPLLTALQRHPGYQVRRPSVLACHGDDDTGAGQSGQARAVDHQRVARPGAQRQAGPGEGCWPGAWTGAVTVSASLAADGLELSMRPYRAGRAGGPRLRSGCGDLPAGSCGRLAAGREARGENRCRAATPPRASAHEPSRHAGSRLYRAASRESDTPGT
jgi:hypothetical protein